VSRKRGPDRRGVQAPRSRQLLSAAYQGNWNHSKQQVRKSANCKPPFSKGFSFRYSKIIIHACQQTPKFQQNSVNHNQKKKTKKEIGAQEHSSSAWELSAPSVWGVFMFASVQGEIPPSACHSACNVEQVATSSRFGVRSMSMSRSRTINTRLNKSTGSTRKLLSILGGKNVELHFF